MGEVFFNRGPWSSLITSSWRENLGQKLLNTGALSFPQGTLCQPWNSAWGHMHQSKVLETSHHADRGGGLRCWRWSGGPHVDVKLLSVEG